MNSAAASRTARRRRGFTLLEAAITLAVLAVVATLALPTLGGTVERARLKAAAENLASDFTEARFESAHRGQALQVDVSPGAGWCWVVATGAGCSCDRAEACRLKTVSARDYAGIEMLDASAARFDPTGSAQALGSAVFRSPRGEQLRVDLTPLGRARICAPDHQVPGYPAC